MSSENKETQDSVRRGDLEGYYDDYWERRAKSQRLHTAEGGHIPVRLNLVLDLIPDYGGFSVLDVGCGEGTLGMMLRDHSTQAQIRSVGCDISRKSVELATPYYEQVHQLDLELDELEAHFGSEKFDFIVCVEVLEHIFYPDKALLKLRKLLKNDGFLIISFPNIAWWKYRLKLLRGHFPEESRLYHHAEHLHDFTMHTFKALVSEADLKIAQLTGEFIPPTWLKRVIPRSALDSHMKKHPNFYGYQVIFKTQPRVT